MELSKPVNTYFICATQTSNLGDLMINKMLVDELCNYGIVYLDALGVPDEFKKPMLANNNVIEVSQYGFSVKRLSVKNLFKFASFIKKNDVRLITRSPGPLEEPSAKIRFGFSAINMLAKLCKAKIVYFGNCCSEALSYRRKLKSTHMDEIYVRSYDSVEYAKQYFSCPVSYIPDMAFLMTTSKSYVKHKTVVIDYRSVADENKTSISDLQSIVSKFISLGYSVELYYQVKSDKERMLSLYNVLKNKSVIMRNDLLWYDEMENFYSDKAFVISNRLHSLLFGAVYGVIPIAVISDDPRVTKIMHVFKSSFPEMFNENINVFKGLDVEKLVLKEEALRKTLNLSMMDNKGMCSKIINKAVSSLL